MPVLVVSILGTVDGCKRTTPNSTEAAAGGIQADPNQSAVAVGSISADAAPSGVTSDSVANSGGPRTPPSAFPSAPKPLSSAEQELAASYLRALGRGRRATVAKDFAAAVSAFDEALKLRPDDGQAIAERGYARLQAKDYPGARADFTEAQHRALSPGLVAQIWYNLGLLEDATGNAVLARDRFEQAKMLREKARTSGAGGKDCPMEVERPNEPAEVFSSWHPMWLRMVEHYEKSFGMPYDGNRPKGTADKDVRVALTGAMDDNKSAWLVPVSDKDGFRTEFHVVGKLANGKWALFAGVAEQQTSRCGTGTRDIQLLLDDVPRVVIENDDVELNYMCEKKNGSVSPCSGEADENPVQGFCTLDSYAFVTKFFDLSTQRQTLTLTETGKAPKSGSVQANLVYVIQRDGVLVTGGNCNRKETFVK